MTTHWSRLAAAAGVGAVALVASSLAGLAPTVRGALCWDAAAVTYLLLVWRRGLRSDAAGLAAWAAGEDERRWIITAVISLASTVSLAAVALLLGEGLGLWRLGLAAGTLACSWLVLHTVFAVHYAHLYCAGALSGEAGLRFPDEAPPCFIDFAYVAFVVGMTFQVSDVATRSARMRGLVLVHALVAFAFNTVLVALALGVAASLLTTGS